MHGTTLPSDVVFLFVQLYVNPWLRNPPKVGTKFSVLRECASMVVGSGCDSLTWVDVASFSNISVDAVSFWKLQDFLQLF